MVKKRKEGRNLELATWNSRNCLCKCVNFADLPVRAQEEPDNVIYMLGKLWKSSFWTILRFVILSFLEEVTSVLVPMGQCWHFARVLTALHHKLPFLVNRLLDVFGQL
jgi:hypothetical protein